MMILIPSEKFLIKFYVDKYYEFINFVFVTRKESDKKERCKGKTGQITNSFCARSAFHRIL